MNDACVALGIPNVNGSVFRFEGQVSVFWPARPGDPGPCYRCLYPEPPPPELAPSCAEAIVAAARAVNRELILLYWDIGRAIVEKALSQGLQCPLPFSISKAIEANKKAYYHALQQAEKGLNITDWIEWFVQTLLEAQTFADKLIQFTISKWHFFAVFENQLNERQNKVINRMLAAGPDSFQGGMNVRKYVGISGTSRATASRDLQELVSMQVFTPVGAGRSARYELVF